MVLDTSALMAILLDEAQADACMAAIEARDRLAMSSVTVAEALIVAAGRGIGEEMARLVRDLGLEVEPVDAAFARRVAAAYGQWGKGHHPAGLNFGDCFGYVLARDRACPLLFVGSDFTRTDVIPAL